MKTTKLKPAAVGILILLIIGSVNECNAQQIKIDSISQKMIKIDLAVNNIHNNMKKTARQYITGAIMSIAGSAIIMVGVNADGPTNQRNLVNGGVALSVVGFGVSLSAFAHLVRGGRARK